MRILIVAMFVVATIFSGVAWAGGGDENYNGEDGEQPGVGVDIGPGETSAPGSPGDRTRFKDV